MEDLLLTSLGPVSLMCFGSTDVFQTALRFPLRDAFWLCGRMKSRLVDWVLDTWLSI